MGINKRGIWNMYFKQYFYHIDFMGDEWSLGSENNDRRNTSLMITPRM